MSADIVPESSPVGQAPPRFKGRMAGLFYLLTILTGGLAAFAREPLVVSGDAAATAANILTHGGAFRWAFTADLLMTSCYLVVTLLFYAMFEPVNRSLSLLAAFFSLIGCAVIAVSCLFYLAPLTVLKGAQQSTAFTLDQLQALAFMLLRLRAHAFNISLAFFGFYCLLIGYLVFRSAFLPRPLGVLMALAGLGWLTYLSPSLASSLYPYVLAPGTLGELALTLWLLVIGIDVQRWKEQAGARAVGHGGRTILDAVAP